MSCFVIIFTVFNIRTTSTHQQDNTEQGSEETKARKEDGVRKQKRPANVEPSAIAEHENEKGQRKEHDRPSLLAPGDRKSPGINKENKRKKNIQNDKGDRNSLQKRPDQEEFSSTLLKVPVKASDNMEETLQNKTVQSNPRRGKNHMRTQEKNGKNIMRPDEQGTAENISREEKNIKKRPREGMIATRQKTFIEKEGVADSHELNHQDERRKGQQRPGNRKRPAKKQKEKPTTLSPSSKKTKTKNSPVTKIPQPRTGKRIRADSRPNGNILLNGKLSIHHISSGLGINNNNNKSLKKGRGLILNISSPTSDTSDRKGNKVSKENFKNRGSKRTSKEFKLEESKREGYLPQNNKEKTSGMVPINTGKSGKKKTMLFDRLEFLFVYFRSGSPL